MRRWVVGIVVIAALGGGILSWISLDHYYTLLRGALEQPSFCNISEQFNCDIVAASSFATLFGQPIAGFGLLYFLVQGLFGVWAMTGGRMVDRRPTAAVGIVLGICSLGYPAYLVVIMATSLHTFCVTCLGMDLALLVILLGWFSALKDRAGGAGRLLRYQWGGHAIVLFLVIGVGGIFLASGTQSAYKATKQPRLSAAQIHEGVLAYQKGSVFDLQLDPATHPVWGNPAAKVTVVEFSDFQCPFCRIAAFTLKSSLAEFRDRIRLLFINYPLDSTCNASIEKPFHPYSCLIARAVTCAQQQGKFWDYHEALFRHQEKISRELILKLAGEQGLDETRLTACMEDPATDAAVKADVAIGQHVHIEGTPTVIVNQRQVHNWRNRDLLRAIIQSELK